jgi:hypothetical protein
MAYNPNLDDLNKENQTPTNQGGVASSGSVVAEPTPPPPTPDQTTPPTEAGTVNDGGTTTGAGVSAGQQNAGASETGTASSGGAATESGSVAQSEGGGAQATDAGTQGKPVTPGDVVDGEQKERVEKTELQPELSWNDYLNRFSVESKADMEKRQRQAKRAAIVNAIGNALISVVNYARVKNGHMNMNVNPAANIANFNKNMESRNDKLDAQRASRLQAAMTAYQAAKDKAAALAEQKRQFELNLAETKSSHAATLALNRDRLNQTAYQFSVTAGQNEAKQAETVRHNRASEQINQQNAAANSLRASAAARTANEAGKTVGESFMDPNGTVYTRKNSLSEIEAKSIIQSYGDDKDKSDLRQSLMGGRADYREIASRILTSGKVPADVLKRMNFTGAKSKSPAIGASGDEGTDWD